MLSLSEKTLIEFFAFCFGAIIGSFLNVVIYRLPLGKSVIKPRSTCSSCLKIIPWYYNIPILSWIYLRGRCGFCANPISVRYPFVELLTAIISLVIFNNDLTITALVLFFVACIFVCHFFIDLDHKILPNSLNFILAVLFFYLGWQMYSFVELVLGGAVGLAVPLFITWAFYKLRGQIGMGGGDLKLFAAMGFYLGIKGILYNMIFSCWIGALGGGLMILSGRLKKENPFAFGPFIILAATIQIFFSREFAEGLRFLGI